jgi:hypothetical protein
MNLRRVVRNLGRTVLIVAGLYIVLLGAFAATIPNLEVFSRVMVNLPHPLWKLIPLETLFNIVRAGSLTVGTEAPDFNLPTVNRQEHIRLSSFQGQKPVVLVFGSYT